MARPLNPSNWSGDTAVTMTAAGTTAGTAATVTADHVMVSVVTSAADGVILRALNASERGSVTNIDTVEALKVYPPSGCQFNGRTADLPATVPSGKSMSYTFLNATQIACIISA